MLDVPRARITRLYRFLGDYTELRSPIKCQIDKQPWYYWLRDLPSYPTIEMSKQIGDDFVLRIQRPKTTVPSSPPSILEEWVEQGWDDPFQSLKVRSSINKIVESNTVTIKIEDDSTRVEAWKTWQKLWQEWAEAEKPLRRALNLYEQMFELRGRLEREGERLELILGDGILSWRSPSPEGTIHHPILLQKVQLDFDPKVPEFRIIESDQAVEFYSAVLRSIPQLEAASIARIRLALAEGDYHPLDEEETSGFFRYVAQQLSSKGVYQDKAVSNPTTDYPVMGRDRVLFLRERNQGFAKAIEAILEKLPETELPQPLLSIVGVEQKKAPDEPQNRIILPGQEPEVVLFSKRGHVNRCVKRI